jgi:hypothetical protein
MVRLKILQTICEYSKEIKETGIGESNQKTVKLNTLTRKSSHYVQGLLIGIHVGQLIEFFFETSGKVIRTGKANSKSNFCDVSKIIF